MVWEAEEEVLDMIDDWHLSQSHLPLHEYLGWSTKQYAAYVEGKWKPGHDWTDD